MTFTNNKTQNFVNKWDYFDFLINHYVETTFLLHDWERLGEKQSNDFKKAVCEYQTQSLKRIKIKFIKEAQEVLTWK